MVLYILRHEQRNLDKVGFFTPLNMAGTHNAKINVYSKENTKKEVRALSSNEINEIKKNIKNKKNKKKIKSKNKKKEFKNAKEQKIITKNNKVANKDVNKKGIKNLDVCTVIENCSIDEISKYLLKQGQKNKFPDITTRQ